MNVLKHSKTLQTFSGTPEKFKSQKQANSYSVVTFWVWKHFCNYSLFQLLMLGCEILFSKTEIIILKAFSVLRYFGKGYWPIKIYNSLDVKVTECLTDNQVHHSLKS